MTRLFFPDNRLAVPRCLAHGLDGMGFCCCATPVPCGYCSTGQRPSCLAIAATGFTANTCNACPTVLNRTWYAEAGTGFTNLLGCVWLGVAGSWPGYSGGSPMAAAGSNGYCCASQVTAELDKPPASDYELKIEVGAWNPTTQRLAVQHRYRKVFGAEKPDCESWANLAVPWEYSAPSATCGAGTITVSAAGGGCRTATLAQQHACGADGVAEYLVTLSGLGPSGVCGHQSGDTLEDLNGTYVPTLSLVGDTSTQWQYDFDPVFEATYFNFANSTTVTHRITRLVLTSGYSPNYASSTGFWRVQLLNNTTVVMTFQSTWDTCTGLPGCQVTKSLAPTSTPACFATGSGATVEPSP